MPARRVSRRAGNRSALAAPARASGGIEAPPGAGTGPTRPARLVEREAPYLINELKRVALVTATCLGLLAFLAIVQRMQ